MRTGEADGTNIPSSRPRGRKRTLEFSAAAAREPRHGYVSRTPRRCAIAPKPPLHTRWRARTYPTAVRDISERKHAEGARRSESSTAAAGASSTAPHLRPREFYRDEPSSARCSDTPRELLRLRQGRHPRRGPRRSPLRWTVCSRADALPSGGRRKDGRFCPSRLAGGWFRRGLQSIILDARPQRAEQEGHRATTSWKGASRAHRELARAHTTLRRDRRAAARRGRTQDCFGGSPAQEEERRRSPASCTTRWGTTVPLIMGLKTLDADSHGGGRPHHVATSSELTDPFSARCTPRVGPRPGARRPGVATALSITRGWPTSGVPVDSTARASGRRSPLARDGALRLAQEALTKSQHSGPTARFILERAETTSSRSS